MVPRNPCLIEYTNEDKTMCARCQYGSVRIFTVDGIFCGSVLDEDGNVYSPPAEGETTFPTSYDYEETDWTLYCEISKYYSTNYEYGDLSFVYSFQN